MFKKFLYVSVIVIFLCCGNNAFSDYSPTFKGALKTGIKGPKGSYGDTQSAYAGFKIQPEDYNVYRITGKFPRARYMSLESSDNRELGDLDFDAIQDHEILPDDGSLNPFDPEVDFNTEQRNFTVDLVPAGDDWGNSEYAAKNILVYPSDGYRVGIAMRIILPDPVFEQSDLDEFTICQINPETGECIQQSTQSLSDNSSKAFQISDIFDASVLYAFENFNDSVEAKSFDIKEALLGLFNKVVPEKWWPFPFKVVNIPFEGNSAVPGYGYALTKIQRGNVGIIKFKAPTVVDTSCAAEQTASIPQPDCYPFAEPQKDLRYWSICSLDLEGSQGLACLSDRDVTIDSDGYVTIVFGPEGGEIEELATKLGYGFLPDNRDELDVVEEPVCFVYRQVLPSGDFIETSMNTGDYLPLCRVFSPFWFQLICKIRALD